MGPSGPQKQQAPSSVPRNQHHLGRVVWKTRVENIMFKYHCVSPSIKTDYHQVRACSDVTVLFRSPIQITVSFHSRWTGPIMISLSNRYKIKPILNYLYKRLTINFENFLVDTLKYRDLSYEIIFSKI